MFNNYFKLATRNLIKYKGFTFINIFGLSVGLTCVFLILLFLREELGFDRFHENAERICRVVYEFKTKTGPDHFALTPAPLAELLENEFPEVVEAVHYTEMSKQLVVYADKQFWENGIGYTDPAFFKMFTFPLRTGNPETVLKNPNTIVLTEKMAQKYFGDENPIGKTLSIGTDYRQDFTVSGVLQNVPANSQLQFNFLIPFQHHVRGNIGWGCSNYSTYILLSSNFDSAQLEQKLADLSLKYPDFIGPLRKLNLQLLTEIHLHSNLRNDLPSNRAMSQVYIFAGIGLLILLLACINYINLTTARFSMRVGEVGMRKVIGANRAQLIGQFLSEAVLVSFFAFLLALVLIEFLLPVFNSFTGKTLNMNYSKDVFFIMILFGVSIVTGLFSGFYPALAITGFQPIQLLQNNLLLKRSDASVSPRKIMVVVQFVISIIFLSGTLILHYQLDFIKHKKLGYEKEHLVVLPIYYDDVHSGYELFKNELLNNSEIMSATATSFLPSAPKFCQNTWWEGLPEDDNTYAMNWLSVDPGFVKTLDLEVIEGRNFSEEFATDENSAYILNESAVKMIGWQNPVGKFFNILARGPVIGVVKDFHFQSLHHELQPLALAIFKPAFKYLLVKIRSENIPGTIKLIGQKWATFFPNRSFEYSFFDEDFDRVYKSEMQLGRIFNYIAGLAILIACLGLLGLASFSTLRRTKEIGIRKVLGATVSNIVIMLSKEFMLLVFLAGLIAFPVTYFVMEKWLQNFAYRISITGWTFFYSTCLALLIALFTIGWQAVRAATANPVKALKYE